MKGLSGLFFYMGYFFLESIIFNTFGGLLSDSDFFLIATLLQLFALIHLIFAL
ncbi:hypothetical protein [Cytobacillus oceanisediminis]|uniref:hypothetical protein n=1 Tax=Cytobacillus oceanisediminis TaxID=665099 RepID=UPI002041243E|nr:hypothetical protein [Cytobacillus oceanisediminis]